MESIKLLSYKYNVQIDMQQHSVLWLEARFLNYTQLQC